MHCVPESVAALRGSYCKTPFDPRVKQLAEQLIGAPWWGNPRSAAQHAACGVHLDALCPRFIYVPACKSLLRPQQACHAATAVPDCASDSQLRVGNSHTFLLISRLHTSLH